MSTRLDVTGLFCPLPVLKARKALSSMKVGDEITVVATDPAAAIDIPHFCQEAGHELVDQAAEGDNLVFTLKKGPDRL